MHDMVLTIDCLISEFLPIGWLIDIVLTIACLISELLPIGWFTAIVLTIDCLISEFLSIGWLIVLMFLFEKKIMFFDFLKFYIGFSCPLKWPKKVILLKTRLTILSVNFIPNSNLSPNLDEFWGKKIGLEKISIFLTVEIWILVDLNF